MKICNIADCGRKHHGKGYCKIHYNEFILKPNNNKCSVEDCENIIGTNGCKGLCCKHYGRLRKYGDENIRLRNRDIYSLTKFVNDINNIDFVFETRLQWATACKIYYGDKCSKCGWNETTCDANHIIPHSKGGLNTIENCEILCPNCHAILHRRPPLDKRGY